jgi:hypothetical protein
MTQKTEKRPGTDCWRFAPIGGDRIVKRPHRREVWGIAYVAQKCRLVPDRPDPAGNASYACKIANVSEGGFGIVCRKAGATPDLFQTGSEMTLEAWDGKRLRVEIRWVNKDRMGVKCFSLSAH